MTRRLGTSVKVSVVYNSFLMANSKIDKDREHMFTEHGTKCLITDLVADKYLAQAKKHGEDRYSKWCGGKGGFDDYAEHLH